MKEIVANQQELIGTTQLEKTGMITSKPILLHPDTSLISSPRQRSRDCTSGRLQVTLRW